MKFDFWLNLPKSLVNLAQNEITDEEVSIASKLEDSKQKLIEILTTRESNPTNETNEFTTSKASISLICESINFSIKLMIKLTDIIERTQAHTQNSYFEILTKTKLLLKITRLVKENSKSEIDSAHAESEFFSTVLLYTEKIQAKLFAISEVKIKYLLSNKEINSSDISIRFS